MADEQKYHLVVTRPFHNQQTNEPMGIGNVITDPKKVESILGSHHASFVVKVPDSTNWELGEQKDDEVAEGRDMPLALAQANGKTS